MDNKTNWRIRLDTWVGHMLYKLSKGHLDRPVKKWYDKKYPHS